MALAVEGTTGASHAVGAGTTITIPLTITSSNLLLVGVGIGFGATPLDGIIAVTWNGTTVPVVSGSGIGDGNFEGAQWYSLINPAAGSFNVVITVDNGAQVGVGVISFTGANLTLKTPSTRTANSTNPFVTVADSESGNIVVSVVATDSGGSLTTPAGTEVFDVENLNTDSSFNIQYQVASGPNTLCSWTNAGADLFAASGLAVAAAGGTPATQILFVGSVGRRRTRYAI